MKTIGTMIDEIREQVEIMRESEMFFDEMKILIKFGANPCIILKKIQEKTGIDLQGYFKDI